MLYTNNLQNMAKNNNKRRVSDGVRWLLNSRGVNPKLGARLSKDGKTESLFLEFYNGGGKRTRQTLTGLTLYVNPTPMQKAQNQNTELAARQKQSEIADNILRGAGFVIPKRVTALPLVGTLMQLAQTAISSKKNEISASIMTFVKYLNETGKARMLTTELTDVVVREYLQYLEGTFSVNTARRYLTEIKKVSTLLYERGLVKSDTLKGARCKKPQINRIEKEVLNIDEVKRLSETHYKGEDNTIRNAFLFTCLSGLRFSDVKGLKWSNVDTKANTLTFVQRKVEKKSSKARVTQYLNKQLKDLIGTPKDGDELIFKGLTTNKRCNSHLAKWCKAADITKRITWHCGRHSYATILLSSNVPINVVSSNLGHSSIQTTNIYIHTLEEQKKGVANTLETLYNIDTKGEN